MQLGAKDDNTAQAIDRLNRIAKYRLEGNFKEAANQLNSDAKNYQNNSESTLRILNELADIYSHHLFDIERAIELDEIITKTPTRGQAQDPTFFPTTSAASQRIIFDQAHYQEFIKISSSAILEKSKERIKKNQILLDGEVEDKQARIPPQQLSNHLNDIKEDIKRAPKGSVAYKMLFSRWVRAEFELSRLNKDSTLVTCQEFSEDRFPTANINFDEISYLQLSEYFNACYSNESKIKYLELSLDTIYKPYINIRAPQSRWKYNKLINNQIAKLIEANFKSRRHDELIYYTSLNKSRMVLEERMAFGDGKGALSRLADITPDDGIPRTPFGLPDKTWFKSKLAGTSHFLDFYVGGAYSTQTIPVVSGVGRTERSVMPLNSRNSARIKTDEPIDAFVDNSLYITQVRSGNVAAIKVDGGQLTQLRREMEQAYEAISNTRAATLAPSLQRIKAQLQLPDNLTVSPDKWIAAHPLDFHLQAKVVRSVNFFTSGSSDRIGQIRVAGFFNPTLDLAGADSEADYIKTLIPTATIVRREAARKSAIKDAVAANVIHLSMHGVFNATDPTMSKLVFAGAKNDDSTDDPSALYANEMISMPALRNRDLVFAAACQTGLAAADRTNSNELIGILRPLTASRNKNIILSLWNVSDAATGEFVKAFYSNLATSQDVKASFHYAQDQLKSQYPHPYYWAAFYLSQAN